eukprot:6177531-Pleurochrysis_carterae.AAC.3
MRAEQSDDTQTLLQAHTHRRARSRHGAFRKRNSPARAVCVCVSARARAWVRGCVRVCVCVCVKTQPVVPSPRPASPPPHSPLSTFAAQERAYLMRCKSHAPYHQTLCSREAWPSNPTNAAPFEPRL